MPYDKTQGCCKNARDYRYYNWLHAITAYKLNKGIRFTAFVNRKGNHLTPNSLSTRAFLVKELDKHYRKEVPIMDPVEAERTGATAKEGRQVLIKHLIRERSPQLIAAFKKSLRSYRCKVCGFDFEKKYGQLGAKFIEAHHQKPISSLKEDEIINERDLVAVCSNCHRMIHRSTPICDWKELKKQLKD